MPGLGTFAPPAPFECFPRWSPTCYMVLPFDRASPHLQLPKCPPKEGGLFTNLLVRQFPYSAQLSVTTYLTQVHSTTFAAFGSKSNTNQLTYHPLPSQDRRLVLNCHPASNGLALPLTTTRTFFKSICHPDEEMTTMAQSKYDTRFGYGRIQRSQQTTDSLLAECQPNL